jgi:hypothetical protein
MSWPTPAEMIAIPGDARGSGGSGGLIYPGEDGLAESRSEPHQGERRPRVSEVLHGDDLVVLQSKGLSPSVASSFLVGPGIRHNNTVTARLHRIEAVVPITDLPSRRDPLLENRTGLVGALSGRRSPEPRQPAPPAPFHLGVDQRDERLDVAFTERLVRGAHRFDRHANKIRTRVPESSVRLVPAFLSVRPRHRGGAPEEQLVLLVGEDADLVALGIHGDGG